MVANPTNLIRVMPAEGLRMKNTLATILSVSTRLSRGLVASLVIAGALVMPAAAQEKPTLTVHTYSSFVGKYGPGKALKERFEETCGCTLAWLTSDDSGGILSRMKLDGESSRADVVLGLDANLAGEAEATGLLAPHGRTLPALDMPVAWSSKTFVPFDWGYLAFVYDETKLKTPPQSLRALVDDPSGPRIIVQDPRTSAPGLGFLLWMKEVYGDQAGPAWTKLRPRIVTFTKGWSEAYGLFLKGEADMVLSYTTSPAYHIAAEKKTQYKAAAFAEGNYLHVELAAAMRTAKQPELAARFIDFVLSERFQELMPEGNWMYPAKTPAAGLPASFSTLVRPSKALLIDFAKVRDGRRGWLDEWLAATAR
jgi:thiamine transport system substrate-binding protein